MNILFVGDTRAPTGSAQRARALQRLGFTVEHIDVDKRFISGRIAVAFHYRTGYHLLQSRIARWLASELTSRTFDVAWVDGGALLGPKPLQVLRRHGRHLINYNCDDPTGPRDWPRWYSFLRGIPHYDALVVVREPSAVEFRARGARRVLKVFRTYDAEDLRALALGPEERRRWASEVVFVGTWMPERGPLLAELLCCGVPLSIYGNRWPRARQWSILQRAVRGPAVEGLDYVKAIQCARISLGLLSKGNRDLHTIRSGEIPYIGSLFCAERTSEHRAMYAEGREAVFWGNAEECAAQCRALLANETRRRTLAENGHRRILELHLAHEDMLADVLNRVCQAGLARPSPWYVDDPLVDWSLRNDLEQ